MSPARNRAILPVRIRIASPGSTVTPALAHAAEVAHEASTATPLVFAALLSLELRDDEALRRDPGCGLAAFYAGGIERQVGNIAEAEARLRRAIKLMSPDRRPIEALKALRRPLDVRLYTDSQYVRRGVTEWLSHWKARGWRTADKKPVKNQDLWERLERALGRHEIVWRWVKGHSGNPDNERADELAASELACPDELHGDQGRGDALVKLLEVLRGHRGVGARRDVRENEKGDECGDQMSMHECSINEVADCRG